LLYKLAILSGSNTIKVVANLLREQEIGWISLVQVGEQRCKEATRLSLWLCAFGNASETVPRLEQLRCILSQGWIKAAKVERSIAAITAKKITASVASCAKVVVVRL
jgi:hypothetical protein